MMQRDQQFRASLEQGLQDYARNDYAAAQQACLQALALYPDHPQPLNLLGATLLQLGEPGQAAAVLERAARADRGNAGVMGNLAAAYVALGRHEAALETYRKASRLDPRSAQFQLGIAIAHAMQGRLAEAETLLRRIISRYPQLALARFNLGNVVRDLQRPEEAVAHYREALDCDPELVDARNNLAGALQALLRFEEAEHECRQCLALAPDHLLARSNLAFILVAQGRFEEAGQVTAELLRVAPDSSIAHSLMGTTLSLRGRLSQALQFHRTAAELAPADSDLIAAHAMALAVNGKVGAALRRFAEALALDSASPLTQQKLSSVLLANGSLADGWIGYAARPARQEFRDRHPDVTLAQHLPSTPEGRHILILREQGLGDELFFLRYAPQISGRGARLTYVASDKIAGPLARASGVGTVIGSASRLPQADAVMLAGDLPHAVSALPSSPLTVAARSVAAPCITDFPRRIALYWPPVPPSLTLSLLEEKLRAVRDRLAAVGKPPYIGVTWRGGIPAREHRSASWTLHKELDKAAFAAALRGVPCTLLALQRNPEAGELATLAGGSGRPMHDFTDLNEDLEGMLALLALIDDYVGVSNTNMHLRAAVGRTARVLVPCPPEWRWMDAGRESPWFPGFRIYRQRSGGGWTHALAELNHDLRKLHGGG